MNLKHAIQIQASRITVNVAGEMQKKSVHFLPFLSHVCTQINRPMIISVDSQ